MKETIANYLVSRPEGLGLLVPGDIDRTLKDLFRDPDDDLPVPYKIFFVDEAQTPTLGFPVLDSPVLQELEMRLDRWLNEETKWSLEKNSPKERVTQAFQNYVTSVTRVAENAMVSNLLADYHAVFWLAHSLDVSRHFAAMPRRVSAIDTQTGRNSGDALKYRIFAKWATEMREQMARVAERVAPMMEGDQDRAINFFRILSENVLILTEEFIGPDLRELRSFVTGYLHRDFNSFRDGFERLKSLAADLLRRDRLFKNAVELFGIPTDGGVTVAMMLNRRFQRFLLDHPTAESILNRDEREQLSAISRRLVEFGVLHHLRRGITFMSLTPGGDLISTDKKGIVYSRTTRPIDFGRPGVVDPVVHRFGLMYDIAAFSETLGNLARSGRKGELNSYRQMVLFQRKVEGITDKHRLQFEKFLGDGAFYTTRRALRLVRAAVELQRFYSEMKRKGFAFDKGMRVALNFGYYRLLPMRPATMAHERVMEFYGPGIVELSRLTTGKATKEIEEIQGFLISHGYNTHKVQEFFAPLAKGVDLIDHRMHAREFYAYVNQSGHLVNEGIVASLPLLQELSNELAAEDHALYRIVAPWGKYFGFTSTVEGVEYVGVRLLGMVSLKGLNPVEVGEIVAFTPGEAEATRLESSREALIAAIRVEYHERGEAPVEPARAGQVEPEPFG